MFGLDQRTTLLIALAAGLAAWGVYENSDWLLGAVTGPFGWLRSKLTTTPNDTASMEAAKKAFAEIMSLRAYAKQVNCDTMEYHLAAAGKCLFDHGDGVHTPAPEVVA